jgi:sigma-E factor negative regulatory protein RseC
MIEETAVVIECEGDHAWVEAQRKSACGQCQVNKGCGTSVLARVLGKKTTRMRVMNPIQAREGDMVVIGLHEAAMLTGSLAVYLLPLLSLLLFAITGKIVAEQLMIEYVEPVTILFAVIGLLVAAVWLRLFTRRIENNSHYQPVIMKRLPKIAVPDANVVHL